MKNKGLLYVLLGLLFIILSLMFIRFFSESQLDDLTPGIQCDEELLAKVDVYYVIPNFQGKIISDYPEWCDKIKNYDKTIRMHGVTHEYREFLKIERNQEYLQEGIDAFETCFNQTPTNFKPPQNFISLKNRQLVKENMKLDLVINWLFHKEYHCNDSGIFSNRFMDFF